jgi:predicted flap endonuclease-1-like 5' DNA nuclease
LVHPGWLADYMPVSAPAPIPVPAAQPAVAASTWVLDHLGPPAQVRLEGTLVVERALLALLVQVAVFLSYLAYENLGIAAAFATAPAALTAGAAVLLAVSAVRYRLLPPVKAKRKRQAVLSGLVKNRRRSQAELDRLVDQRSNLDQLEAEEFSTLQRRLAETDQAEAEEISATFSGYQAQFIHSQLKRNNLAQAHLPGIGPELRRRLTVAGIQTAADVTERVKETAGIGPARAAVLLGWRQQLEAGVRHGQPHSLPVLQETAIRARYLTERQSLRSRAAEVQASYQAQRGDLEGQEKETRRLLTGASAAIARTQRELHAYRQIAFLRYLRRIVFL